MYALIIYDEVLIFDLNKHYGIYKYSECKLVDFLKVLEFNEVINYCSSCFIDSFEIMPYLEFLHYLCVKYLKDCFCY